MKRKDGFPMKENTSVLFSQYIIDGNQMDETPFSALLDCLDGNGTVDVPTGPFNDIIDNSLDKAPQSNIYNENMMEDYVDRILRTPFDRKAIDLSYPVSSTISAINNLLLECLFKDGHFCLQDLLLMAKWDWNNKPEGNLAAFYDSTVGAGHYLFDLGVKLDRYFVEENRKACRFEISLRSKISSRRQCADKMVADSKDLLIYIPFSNSRMCLGGSALSKVVGHGSGADPDFSDADYFMDCYEVVRELVEDKVIVAGIPTGRGGLATAAEKFRGKNGITINVNGIISATGEKDIIKILFSEQPGVLVQIHATDLDYLDSQLLLQEVAYCPIGNPDPTTRRVSVRKLYKEGISNILSTLLGQATEGED